MAALGDQILEVLFGMGAALFGGLDHRVERGCCVRTIDRLTAQEVFPSYDHMPECSLGIFVRDRCGNQGYYINGAAIPRSWITANGVF